MFRYFQFTQTRLESQSKNNAGCFTTFLCDSIILCLSTVTSLDLLDYAILAAASNNNLRHNAVFWADFEIITQIDIILEGNAYAPVSELNGIRRRDQRHS